MLKVRFLGTGSSAGVPVPGCRCNVCASQKNGNRRYRPGLLIYYHQKNILIDAPQELRLQLLESRARTIDALLITHCHADHVYGLDDVRIFSKESKLPVFGGVETLSELKAIFPYVFKRTQKAGAKPRLRLVPLDACFQLFGKEIIPLPVYHGKKRIYGYRIDGFAYIPDCSQIPRKTFLLLNDLNILVIDALRLMPHPTHFCLSESIDVAKKIRAGQTYFTHLSHEIDYSNRDKLPLGMDFAYDGLVLSVPT